jgi:hypothetical protein
MTDHKVQLLEITIGGVTLNADDDFDDAMERLEAGRSSELMKITPVTEVVIDLVADEDWDKPRTFEPPSPYLSALPDERSRFDSALPTLCPICHHYHGPEPGACWADVEEP